VAFRDFLPDYIWTLLTELSNFFRDLCAIELNVEHMEEFERNIVVTLCKLEKIFPPAFFDSMEHLIIHLAYEVKVGGPVLFRWMYLFERSYLTFYFFVFFIILHHIESLDILNIIWSYKDYEKR
jgi:Domain of unknown function (DUF4218)